MADNTLQQENKSISTEDIAGHQVQRIKLAIGAAGVDGGDVDASNPLPTVLENQLVARGACPGKTHVHIFGSNFDVDTAAAENIWAAGGLYTFPPAAETFSIVSTSALDNGVTPSTGARSVRVQGLDAAWAEAEQTVVLNGTTPVITGIFTSVHRVDVMTAGAGLANAGAITVTGVTSSLLVADFPIGSNSSSLGHYMIPAGKTGYLEKLILSASRSGNASIIVKGQLKLFGTDTVFLTIGEIGTSLGGLAYEFTTPPTLPERSQLKFLAEAMSNNTTVSVFAEILLIDN